MVKLKTLILLLFSSSYYVVTNKGTAFGLPRHRQLLEALQDELENLDRYVEDTIMELILEERD